MNLKVRIKQKWFWITLIPLLFLLVDQVQQFVTLIMSMSIGEALYGSEAMNVLVSAIGVVFVLLALIGFPVDMTTEGYGDSARALKYTEPMVDSNVQATD